jgi:hypothetical protein
MKFRNVSRFGALVSLLVAGCAGNREFKRIEALRGDPAWPMIRAAAEVEVAHRDGNAHWSHSAYYAPEQHTNGVWVVVASGAYPLNRFGDSIDMLVRDSGEVFSYSPRMEKHPK